jgi:dienelactone hydrolase
MMAVGLWAVAGSAVAFAQEAVTLNVGEVQLGATWYPGAKTMGSAPAPAIVALHGCGGMFDRTGHPSEHISVYAQLLNQQGWRVLAVDSLGGRGYDNVCGRSRATVSPEARVPDVVAAVQWLAQQPLVDVRRIGVLGWSHGGSTVLLSQAAGVAYEHAPRAAVAFYPGCGRDTLPRNWQPARPLLLQLGAADDWTDPRPCQQLAKDWSERIVQGTYDGEGHAFDHGRPVRSLQIPNGNHGTRTVHIGGDGVAVQASRARMVAFFKEQFQ